MTALLPDVVPGRTVPDPAGPPRRVPLHRAPGGRTPLRLVGLVSPRRRPGRHVLTAPDRAADRAHGAA